MDEMLRDLRSVKLQRLDRMRVDALRRVFESSGSVPAPGERWLHDVCRRYHKQLQELCAARERARRTNALRGLGLTRAEAEARAAARRQADELDRSDLGF